MSGRLLKDIKSMYINSLACGRKKWGEKECFSIDSGLRQLHHVSLAFQCVYGCSNESSKDFWRRGENGYCMVSCMHGFVWWAGGGLEGHGRTFCWCVEGI